MDTKFRMHYGLIAMAWASLSIFGGNAEAGIFRCLAQELVNVEVVGLTKAETGNPLIEVSLTLVDDIYVSLPLGQVTEYRNEMVEGVPNLVLRAMNKARTRQILEVVVQNGESKLSLDNYGLYLKDVPAKCKFD